MLPERESTAISRARERRRERILRNSDQRIRKILSGPDGTEIRNAPALEGGQGFEDLVRLHGNPISEIIYVYIQTSYIVASLDDFMNKNNGGSTTSTKSRPSFFISCTSVGRLWKALLIGLLMRLAVSFLLIQNIIWPWIIFYMMSTCKEFFQLSSSYDVDGHLSHSRLHLGSNIDLLAHAGAIVQNLWRFFKEFLVVALSFILFNALFCVFAFIVVKSSSIIRQVVNFKIPVIRVPLDALTNHHLSKYKTLYESVQPTSQKPSAGQVKYCSTLIKKEPLGVFLLFIKENTASSSDSTIPGDFYCIWFLIHDKEAFFITMKSLPPKDQNLLDGW
ncbi:unnamed protein product [Litomosoides sigmodontis]|uniref:Uncharacterized protein n=1 Tax=Litomosoides sigmodontis TaxID=42156 RepID=A0A3P6T747_LITSI|nr:unnamed protein product [Litomosoides sigmodontis]